MKKIICFLLSFTLLFSFPIKANAVHDKSGNTSKEQFVVISFAGDCTLGEYKGQGVGNQFKDYYNEFGADYFFSNVKDIFEKDDITFVNLEGPLTIREATAQKKFPIHGDVRNIECLTSSSVEVVNLANNHTYDCGIEGYIETEMLLDKNGIGYCGQRVGYMGESTIFTTTKNGISVSFFGYNGWSIDEESKKIIKSDLGNCKSNIKIVEFHWGVEREYTHNKTQENFAHWAIDCGADMVIGAHPHVLQDTEYYNGKFIAYSLGNFCFGANKNPNDKDSVIIQATFDKNGDYTIDAIPCSISSVDTKNDYRPTIVSDTDRMARIFSKLKFTPKD